MPPPTVAVKASARPELGRRASYGSGTGMYDPTGVTKELSPENSLIENHQYWIPDRLKVIEVLSASMRLISHRYPF
jgi:hypothetical protein